MMRLAGPVVLLSAALCSAVPASGAEPQGPISLMTRAQAVSVSIQNKLAESFRDASEAHKEDHGALVEFYAGRSSPVWLDENGLTKRGRAVVAEIEEADSWGLRAADYKLPDIRSLKNAKGRVAAKLARAEIMISYAFLGYARDARGGRAVAYRSGYFDPTLTLVDPLDAMQSVSRHAEPDEYLVALHPPHPQFHALRKKLVELRAPEKPEEEEEEKLVRVPDGPLLRVGMSHPHVALVRARLDVEPADGVKPELFDEALLEEVREFQASKGIMQDGLVGPGTRRLMNGEGGSKSSNRERQILTNMERWRHVPRDLGELHVNVNIPEFLVRVREKGKVIHTERVVVGKGRNQTPVFSDKIEFIVFNPYWNVPNSIKVEEIRPYLRRTGGGFFFSPSTWDTRVIDRHHLKVRYRGRNVDPSTVQWDRVDIRNYHFYQPPGSWNVLGNMKFMFPNRHAVYLHDTNSKNLFAQSVRMESHGCVRVRNPAELAHILLSKRVGWSMGQIRNAVADSHDRHVQLGSPVPIHITYFTLWVNEDGSLEKHRDVYGQDARLAAALKL